METIFTVIGMILAFLAGAYVRKPFERAKKEEPPAETAGPTLDEEEKRKIKQLENLMNYTGALQDEDA